MENQAGKYTYKHTVHACYTGYITQAIINNLTPLLFTIFQTEFGITFEEVGRLILINFGVQDVYKRQVQARIPHNVALALQRL